MNQLMLLVVALALFVYFGGSMVPSVLRKNKEILLGVAVGLVLCSFMGMRLEGFDVAVWRDISDESKTTMCSVGRSNTGHKVWTAPAHSNVGYFTKDTPNKDVTEFDSWCESNKGP
jgi:hypothetical protein